MKRKATELDVDFVGSQNDPLTKEEQLAISTFIKQLKEKNSNKTQIKSKKQPSSPKGRTITKVLV
ncbi:hypothetical protein P1X15_15615 [Runella sp. MFBS21]|uniref:hypothetical protein n=1 Tax=Runella sp. MFBS21 TaxID=3034018 RepID=UPI0023F8B123|nr:hypothetical protein [Runella sp. MFBS21]MDF7819045.1 hypothetical protein [Runella sp. MFBS21]